MNMEKLKLWASEDRRRRANVNIDTAYLGGKWEVVLYSNEEDSVCLTGDDLDRLIDDALEKVRSDHVQG